MLLQSFSEFADELPRLCRRITYAVPSIGLGRLVLSMNHVRALRTPARMLTREHTHAFCEAKILLEGVATDQESCRSWHKAGSLFCYAPHVKHCWQTGEEPCLAISIGFQPISGIAWPAEPVRSSAPDALSDVVFLLREASSRSRGWDIRATAYLTALFSRILPMIDTQAVATQEVEIDLVSAVHQFIQQHLAQPISIDDIAMHVGMSKRSLQRHFSQLTGETVNRCLLTARMDHAAELLINSDLSLAGIARAVGIHDPSYFCRAFRRKTGRTPHTFRCLSGTLMTDIANQE